MSYFDKIQMARPRLNKFDLSHDRKMSIEFGKLYPCYVQDVVPGDKLRVSSEVMMRFAPLIAPIMHRVNVYVHYFFVPNRLVWDEWEDFITGGESGTLAPVAPALFVNETSKSHFAQGRLYDYFGFPSVPQTGTVTAPITVSSLPARAYVSIYNDYYRDQNAEPERVFSKASGILPYDNTQYGQLSTVFNRCYEKDYFTSALPFAQRGPAITMPISGTGAVTYKNTSLVKTDAGVNFPVNIHLQSGSVVAGDLEGTGQGKARIENIDTVTFNNGTSTINDFRRALKLQEWAEKNMRAGSRYTEQILSHFGVVSPDARLQRAEYLGGGKQPVSISEVLNTTGTTGQLPQGNMAGHAVSVGRTNQFSRRFTEHGYVIGIMSVLPRTAYQQGVPRHLTRFDKFDYYWPEFSQIGEQEVKNKELYYNPLEAVPTFDQTFGYQSRYAEYKYIPSTVHGEFRSTLSQWHLGRIFSAKPLLNSAFLYCLPQDQSRIFAVTRADNQHLWCHVYNKVDALRPMPYFGVPSI